MFADSNTLRERVLDATRASPIAAEIGDVQIEADRRDDDDVLRVLVRVKHPDRASDDELIALIRSIEEHVGELDERYPSVRFIESD